MFSVLKSLTGVNSAFESIFNGEKYQPLRELGFTNEDIKMIAAPTNNTIQVARSLLTYKDLIKSIQKDTGLQANNISSILAWSRSNCIAALCNIRQNQNFFTLLTQKGFTLTEISQLLTGYGIELNKAISTLAKTLPTVPQTKKTFTSQFAATAQGKKEEKNEFLGAADNFSTPFESVFKSREYQPLRALGFTIEDIKTIAAQLKNTTKIASLLLEHQELIKTIQEDIGLQANNISSILAGSGLKCVASLHSIRQNQSFFILLIQKGFTIQQIANLLAGSGTQLKEAILKLLSNKEKLFKLAKKRPTHKRPVAAIETSPKPNQSAATQTKKRFTSQLAATTQEKKEEKNEFLGVTDNFSDVFENNLINVTDTSGIKTWHQFDAELDLFFKNRKSQEIEHNFSDVFEDDLTHLSNQTESELFKKFRRDPNFFLK